MVARWLYGRFPQGREGQLTEIRAALVKRATLARVAAEYELGTFLLGRGEEASGGRTREQNLARAFEAVVGAVLLDRGFGAAAAFIRKSLKHELGPGQGATDNRRQVSPGSRSFRQNGNARQPTVRYAPMAPTTQRSSPWKL